MKSALLALLLLVAAAANAQPYVFGSVAGANITAKVGDGLSKSTTVFSLGGGYCFNKYIAAEGSYLMAGRLHSNDADRVSGASTLSTGHKYEVKGFTLSALGALPVSAKFAALGKLGLNRLTVTHRATTTETAPSGLPFPNDRLLVSIEDSKTREDLWVPSIGIGAQFSPAREFQVRAMLEQVQGRGTLDKMRMLSVSAVFAF